MGGGVLIYKVGGGGEGRYACVRGGGGGYILRERYEWGRGGYMY